MSAAPADGPAAAGLSAEDVEKLLGDPYDAANPHGFAAAVARDERDAFPEELCRTLCEAGFHLNYLPREWGGTFVSFDHSLTLVRAAARRDVNVMPGTMFSIIAATCLQLHGTPEQRAKVAAILRDGGAVAFALTEAAHGSELLANEVRWADGLLHGEKWIVGNGMRAAALYAVVRTGERGPGAMSAVLLDLADAPAGRLVRVPGPRTGGMRGIDLARVRFDALPVPPQARVGAEGEGLEVAIKAQQAVRLMSMAGSLGIADSAVRLTLDFVAARRFGRAGLGAVPHVRRETAVASAALLAADAVALAAARGVHGLPEAFSVWGPVAKHVVAEATDELVRRCGGVLATRAVLREDAPGGGLFQKLQRDSSVVRVIDASPLANVRSYAGQLPTLLHRTAAAGAREQGGGEMGTGGLAGLLRFDAPLPPYRPGRLDLVVRGADPVLGALPGLLAAAPPSAGRTDPLNRLATAVAGLPDEAEAARRPGAGPNALVDLAERFAWLHGAAACVGLWAANRDRALYGTEPGSTGWLEAAVGYLLARADGVDPRRCGDAVTPALDVVARLRDQGLLFTALPVRLAATR
ncbi:acyl-CoA dehydrogenase family protein [Streptomyces sp. TRM 70351]|uniref:acyl-CoA dehydrogenase family protein n=1 Tax=Streptomyces sp. TRM 70351 TaxID=3116552 RepID=UPI002E7B05BC|nr:acyl-CoA dehydrogenase family protein [Streptomyces sp. TRM 70351]MEE1931390.1 acyl-CoA dehydrogenase family protein [Streptomyces sp. TRM 70351]